MTDVAVTIYLNVYDEKRFRDAAHGRALEDGLDEEDAGLYKDGEAKSLAECAQMLIDTGTSPDGAEVFESTAE